MTPYPMVARPSPVAKPAGFLPNIEHFAMLSPSQLEGTDIAVLNLVCSRELPGGDQDMATALKNLDIMAESVRSQTAHNLHRYYEHPEDFHHSLSYFKAAMMITVLQQDFGLHYNLKRMQDLSMAHGEDVFITGLLGNLREGTCSSMPVLYVAVGRRLEYPVFLVSTRGHFFARWDSPDGRVRFNIEATANGMTCHPDSFYASWPYKLSDEELKSGSYLRDFTSADEFAVFMELRGNVLDAIGCLPEAERWYTEAHALLPNNPEYFGWVMLARGKEEMYTEGLLNPNDPKNPYKDKRPLADITPPDNVAHEEEVHDTGP